MYYQLFVFDTTPSTTVGTGALQVLGGGSIYGDLNLGGNLTQISTSLNGAFNAPIIGLFLLGLIFKSTNELGAIVGTAFGNKIF